MSPAPIAEKPGYVVALGVLLVIWVLFSAATVFLLLALFLPDHAGLNATLRALGDLLPSNPVIYTTRAM